MRNREERQPVKRNLLDARVRLEDAVKQEVPALVCAKADGRRTYRFFEPEMDARVHSRRALEHDLRDASAGGDLTGSGADRGDPAGA